MKKVALVLCSTIALACAAVAPVALGSAGAARAVGPSVTVEVRSLTKTLLRPTAARGHTGWVTTGGTPTGKCSASSAAGALDVATHGRWKGKYFSGIGIFVKSILGMTPTGSYYWGLYVNGKYSSLGICDVKLRAGERLLFKIRK
jgi:hypothetical protein